MNIYGYSRLKREVRSAGEGEEERVWDEPRLRNDYVVEGGVAFTEAGEADFKNHCF